MVVMGRLQLFQVRQSLTLVVAVAQHIVPELMDPVELVVEEAAALLELPTLVVAEERIHRLLQAEQAAPVS